MFRPRLSGILSKLFLAEWYTLFTRLNVLLELRDLSNILSYRSMQNWPAVRLIRAATRVEESKMKSCVFPAYMVVSKLKPLSNRTLMICAWFASLRLCLLPQQSRYNRIIHTYILYMHTYRRSACNYLPWLVFSWTAVTCFIFSAQEGFWRTAGLGLG